MIRREKTVTTKDGYIIKKRSLTLKPDHYYSITDNHGKCRGFYTYKELFDTLAILRLFKCKK